MTFSDIISLLGGIALFLFGMSLMGDSLKKVAGSKLEVVLYRLAGTPVKSILLGTGVTAVIQSSSATSAMAVGFVNAGMMKLNQATGIILGALVGTSVTGWVLCLNQLDAGGGIGAYFNTAVLTGLLAIAGILIRMISKKQSKKHIGDILMGLAVLLFGMSTMSSAVSPLKESPAFLSFLSELSNPILGILFGCLLSAVLQSASAAVGILQVLSVTGALDFRIAFPVMLGIAVGASIPVLLTAIGASPSGKRTAFVYLFANLFGVIALSVLYYVPNAFLRFAINDQVMTMVSVALVNSLSRVAMVVLLAPFMKQLDAFVTHLFPESEEDRKTEADFERLEERFLPYPSLALEQVQSVMLNMAKHTKDSIDLAISLRKEYSEKTAKEVLRLEDTIDKYEDRTGKYLMQVSVREMRPEESNRTTEYLHLLTDFERISDHAKNIAESCRELHEKKMTFSPEGQKDLSVLENAILEILSLSVKAFSEQDKETALLVEPLEDVIDELCKRVKSNHIHRLQEEQCTLEHGFVYNDLLSDFERISDHASNVALAVINVADGDYDPHAYLAEYEKSEAYAECRKSYAQKYAL